MIRVGLESHVCLNSKNKLFCNCLVEKNSCVICEGVPGFLPSFNNSILPLAYRLTEVLNSKCSFKLCFFRKHYYYYDLPCGFQRSQHPSLPFSKGGSLKLYKHQEEVEIEKIFLEEDPASQNKYGIDHSRTGSPLLEVVTKPCFVGPVLQVQKKVQQYLQTLSRLCVDLGISDSSKVLKTDVNVSLYNGNFKYEIKNVTSFQDIKKSIAQAFKLLTEDKEKTNKTFHFKNKLIFSRQKKQYLYLKQWNIPPITLTPSKELPLTLYYLLKEGKPKRYTYYKQIYKGLEHTSPEEIIKLINLTPTEGLKKITELKYSKEIIRQIVVQWLIKEQIRFEDYSEKNLYFLKSLKKLKEELGTRHIKFNSNLLYTIIEQYYRPR